MQIKEERRGNIRIIAIDDHLDTSTSTVFEARLTGLIDSGVHQVLVDCASLSYVNSAGLKVLLMAVKKLEPFGGQLILCALQPNVLLIFQMIGFTRVIQITPDRESAFLLFRDAPAPAEG